MDPVTEFTCTYMYYLLSESGYWCIDLAWSIYQGLSLRFPCNDQRDKVNKFFTRLISYLLNDLFIMDLNLQSIKTNNWPADNLKKHITSVSCTFELWYSQVTLVSGCPFWQLAIDHNMDVRNDVHYQVKHRWYMPWTSSLSNARSLQENNAWSLQENSQSDRVHYCNHTCMYNKLN